MGSGEEVQRAALAESGCQSESRGYVHDEDLDPELASFGENIDTCAARGWVVSTEPNFKEVAQNDTSHTTLKGAVPRQCKNARLCPGV